MKIRSSIVWIVVLLFCVSMASLSAQRGGGGGGGGRGGGGGGQGRGGGGRNPGNQPNNNGNNTNNNNPRGGRGNLPAEGSTREDLLRIQNKSRPMLDLVEQLQIRTGRPISYEDPLWVYEGTKEKAGDVKRVAGLRVAGSTAPVKDLLSLTSVPAFEWKMVVDARSHYLAEPVDGSIDAVLKAMINDYNSKQLPGIYTHAYLGDVNDGGYGWVVLPLSFRDKTGKVVDPVRILDYPITFPTEERATEKTFQLIVDLVTKASGQPLQFKKVKETVTLGGGGTTLEAVDLTKNQFVKLGATKETARSVIAKALRQIERGDPRVQGPIPQRAWRLLYTLDKGYVLNVVEVRKAAFQINGSQTGTSRVDWPTSPTAAARGTSPAAVPAASGPGPTP